MRTLAWSRWLLVLGLVACDGAAADKGKGKTAPKSESAPVMRDGARVIAVEASGEGYKPASITAKPNEVLILDITRTTDSACMAQIKVADGPVTDLPKGKTVPFKVTAPASGKLGFVCGMDMVRGTIVVST